MFLEANSNVWEKIKMATCCHRRQYLRNCISRAGKARNAVICAKLSAMKMMSSSPELIQRARSWSLFLIYIRNLSYDTEMDKENQDYLDYKQKSHYLLAHLLALQKKISLSFWIREDTKSEKCITQKQALTHCWLEFFLLI